MKKNIIFLTLTILCFFLTGCLGPIINEENANNSTQENSSDKEISKEKSNSSNEKYYYGVWSIDRYVQINNTPSKDTKKINSYIGKKITISNNILTNPNSSMNTPKFEEKELDNDSLQKTYNLKIQNLGSTSSKVTEITVSNYSINDKDNVKIGSTLFLVPNNRLYIVINGSFYELKKLNSIE